MSALARVCHCTSLTPKWLVLFDLDSDSPAQFSMGWFKSLLIFFFFLLDSFRIAFVPGLTIKILKGRIFSTGHTF